MAEKLQLDVEIAILGGDRKPGQKSVCRTHTVHTQTVDM